MTIISHEHKFIFLKTRKTAGSSLEKCLFPFLNPETDICTGGTFDDGYPTLNYPPRWNTHLSIRDLYDFMNSAEFEQCMKEYFVFTIERNPWEKVASMYFWLQKTKPHAVKDMTFEDYIRLRVGTVSDWHLYNLHNSGVRYGVSRPNVYDYANLVPVRKKFSKMGIDIEESFSKTKLKENIIDKPKDYRELYTNEKMILTVQQKFAKEINMMGYVF